MSKSNPPFQYFLLLQFIIMLIHQTIGFVESAAAPSLFPSQFSSVLDLTKQQMADDIIMQKGNNIVPSEWKGFRRVDSSNSLLKEEQAVLLKRMKPVPLPDAAAVRVKEEPVPSPILPPSDALLVHAIKTKDLDNLVQTDRHHNHPPSLSLNLGFDTEDEDYDLQINPNTNDTTIVKKRQSILEGIIFPPNPITEKYKDADEFLNNLKHDMTCLTKLRLCAVNPLTSMDCVLECYIKTNALRRETTKFIYRTLYVFVPYALELCQTYGTIYDKIQTDILYTHHKNNLVAFMAAVGFPGPILDTTSDTSLQEFKENGAQTLFNNLVNHGVSDDFQIVKGILEQAATWWNAEVADLQTFLSTYSNPVCPQIPRQQWLVTMITQMAFHPVNADIFLRGYYVMTRALSQGMPYPIDNLFVSNVFALKLMVGLECSLISYAEQGNNFHCIDPPMSDSILQDYSVSEKEDEDPLEWIVCGAHQVEIPNWGELVGRRSGGLSRPGSSSDDDEGGDGEDEESGDDSDKGTKSKVLIMEDSYGDVFEGAANPDEIYNYGN